MQLNKRRVYRAVTMIGLIVIFFAPVFFARLATTNSHFSFTSKVNQGELITPSISINDMNIKFISGKPLTTKNLKQQWQLFYVMTDQCNSECQNALYKMRQVNSSLGKEAYRINRLVMGVGSFSENNQRFFKEKKYTEQHLLVLPVLSHGIVSGRVYLADPLGNIMMTYPADFKMKALYQDLSRLLKASQIG